KKRYAHNTLHAVGLRRSVTIRMRNPHPDRDSDKPVPQTVSFRSCKTLATVVCPAWIPASLRATSTWLTDCCASSGFSSRNPRTRPFTVLVDVAACSFAADGADSKRTADALPLPKYPLTSENAR